MKKRFFLAFMIACAIFTVSCSDDEAVEPENPTEETLKPYVIAGDSEEGAVYLLQTDNLNSGDLTIKGVGLEADAATAWEFHAGNKYLYRLVYNQGNPGVVTAYELNDAGKLKQRSVVYNINNRFTTYGSYGKYIVMAAAGTTSFKTTADVENADEIYAQGVTFTIIDTEAQTSSTKTIVTENFLGNGEYVTFSGIVEMNGKLYTAICPLGVSEYAVAEGYANEVRTSTNYPDNVWVAVFDGLDFENPTIIEDDRLSYATSRYRSQFYSNIAVDENKNVYVFSSSYDDNTTKNSGVLRINVGTTEFDKEFYFDIEAATGGIHLFKVWYISENYFLINTYSDVEKDYTNTKKLAIFNAQNKTFEWVSGLPVLDNIGSFGKNPYMEEGVAYLPVITLDGNDPSIYKIDPKTATATKTITVAASVGISAVGKLTN